MLKLSKTTSPQKLFDYDCLTLNKNVFLPALSQDILFYEKQSMLNTEEIPRL